MDVIQSPSDNDAVQQAVDTEPVTSNQSSAVAMSGDEKIDVGSPYYLGSGDQPGNFITHVILTGDNYVAWARAITLSLKARRKFLFVDGTIAKPIAARSMLNWETMNSMIVSWILRSIDVKIAALIPYHVEAKPIWDYLERQYCVTNGPRLQQLRANIVGCRQTKGMSVDDYFNQLMSLYDELSRLKPMHACSCGACVCRIAEKFAEDREEEKLHQFLIGIDDELYSVTRSNLLSQPTPVTLDRAYQVMLQEEKSRDIARGKAVQEETHAFALRVDQPTSRTERPDKGKLSVATANRRAMKLGTASNYMDIRSGGEIATVADRALEDGRWFMLISFGMRRPHPTPTLHCHNLRRGTCRHFSI